MRVLLDVNILLRANDRSQGPARSLLLIGQGHTLLISGDMLVELARVLRYPRVLAIYLLSEEQIYEYVRFPANCMRGDFGGRVTARSARSYARSGDAQSGS